LSDFTLKGLEKLFTHHLSEEWIEYLCLDPQKRIIQGAYTILFMEMPLTDLQKVIKRLRFKSGLQKNLIAANQIWHKKVPSSFLTPGELCLTLENYPPLAVYCNWLIEENKDIQEKYEKYIHQWRLIYPLTTGNDLKQYGIPPGPIYRNILDKLRMAWINNEISSNEEEKQLIKKILSKKS